MNEAFFPRSKLMNLAYCSSRVPDQNSVSLLYIMLEVHHSGREPQFVSIIIEGERERERLYVCV